MSKSNGYKASSRKVGYKRFVGEITRSHEEEVYPNFFRSEINLIATIYDKNGLPFASDDTARKYAKKALPMVRKEG